MNTLSLPSTFPEWTWQGSNGIASAAQTAQAYQALLNGGQCANFSRLVWNDLINLLDSALTQVGLSWDSQYTTAAAAKINSRYGTLTAQAFNSVRHNIALPTGTTWRWAFDSDFTGYVGRENFIGVSTNRVNADTVYGAYIIELARKLNVLIRTLKDTADFGEMATIITPVAAVTSELVCALSVYLSSTVNSVAVSNALFTVQEPFGANVSVFSHASAVSALDLISIPGSLRSAIQATAAIDAAMELFRFYASFRSTILAGIDVQADFSVHATATQTANTTVLSTALSALLYLADALPLTVAVNPLSLVSAEGVVLPSRPFTTAHTAAGMASGALVGVTLPPMPMMSSLVSWAQIPARTAVVFPALRLSGSQVDTEAVYSSGAHSFPATAMQRHINATMAYVSEAHSFHAADATVNISAVAEVVGAVIASKIKDLGIRSYMLSAVPLSNLALSTAKDFTAEVSANARSAAVMEFVPMAFFDADTAITAEICATIEAAPDTWLRPIQTDTDLYIRQAWLSFTVDNDLHIDSPIDAEISADTEAQAGIEAKLSGYAPMTSTVYAMAISTGALYVDGIWTDPEQDGTNLYIVQAYGINQTNQDLEVT